MPIFFIVFLLVAPPRQFPIGKPIEVEMVSGSSIGDALWVNHVISSSIPFDLTAQILGVDTKLKAGRYVFSSPLPWPAVLWRVTKGEYGTKSRKVTIPEGYDNEQISKLVGVEIGLADQGYLFPDTYFFDEFSTAQEVRARLKDNFNARVGMTTKDTVTLASIIEAEAATTSDRRMVAGVLLKRLKIGMPLQVDVATSTYEHTGLPSGPINNPGLDAIDAARNPTDSPYWYYISDRNGIMHYARTFAEHKANRERYGI
ncbi:MAG TPA: endolytic transglycosylase MltG [Candidatus Paceibacterota bacterium]